MQNILWGKCQENTINFYLPKFSFINAGLGRLWYVCGYREVNVKDTPYFIFLCVIYKNKHANLTSNFVDENFYHKTFLINQKTAIIKTAVFDIINQINSIEHHQAF